MNYLKTLVEIALFKGKPHDIAYNISYPIIAFIVALFVGVSAATAVGNISTPISFVFVQLISLGLFFYLILVASDKISRFVQSASSLYGTIALFQISAYLLIFIFRVSPLATFIYLWSAVVQIYIFRETLECKTLKAVALYAGIQFSTNLLLLMMFPELIEILQKSMAPPTQSNS